MQYTILPTDRDIVHRYHKYKDKVRTSSGRWRYIYDTIDSKRQRLRNSYSAQRKLREKVRNNQMNRSKMISYQNKRQQQINELENRVLNAAREGNTSEMESRSKELQKLIEISKVSIESFNNYNYDIDVTKKEYYNTPMGKAEQKIPGFSLVLDWLERRK